MPALAGAGEKNEPAPLARPLLLAHPEHRRADRDEYQHEYGPGIDKAVFVLRCGMVAHGCPLCCGYGFHLS